MYNPLGYARRYYPITNYRCCTGGPLSIMGDNSPCIFPICSAYIWQEIWHTCNCLIYRVKLDLYAERLIYREKESLYAERNGYYSYCNIVKKIVFRTSICIFSSYFLFVDASLTIFVQISAFARFVVQKYRVVGRPSYKMNIRPPFPPVIRT